jgi:hypothetical protein
VRHTGRVRVRFDLMCEKGVTQQPDSWWNSVGQNSTNLH